MKNTQSIFYPDALVWLSKNHYVTYMCVFGFSPLWVLWYIECVVANILDRVGDIIFLDLPIWGLQKAEEYEKVKELKAEQRKQSKQQQAKGE
jgi:hypothetical protein